MDVHKHVEAGQDYVTGVTFGFSVGRFRYLQRKFHDNTGSLKFQLRWRTKTTHMDMMKPHLEKDDYFTVEMHGSVNPCYDAMVSLT
jgi:hypothetical protein